MTSAIMGQSVPSVNSKAPDFNYVSYTGESVRLSEVVSKPVLLVFWFPGCGPCRGELPQLEKLYHQYSDKGFRIIALDVTGDAAGGKRFVNQKQLSFTFLDADMDVASAYGVSSTPTLILLDSERKIVKKYQGHHQGLKTELQILFDASEPIVSQ